MGTAQTHAVQGLHRCGVGVVGLHRGLCKWPREVKNPIHRGRLLGRAVREGENPVPEMSWTSCVEFLSTVGHEKPCWNLGGPPSKAKDVIATDSEEVP